MAYEPIVDSGYSSIPVEKTDEQKAQLADVAQRTGEAIRTGKALPEQAYTGIPKSVKTTDDETPGDEQNAEKSDAYTKLYNEFKAMGLESLVEDAKGFLMNLTKPAEMPNALRTTNAYVQRFSANDKRKEAGFKAISPAAYLALEDQYQKVMRNYGLPDTYYTKDATGKQAGFDNLIAGDVDSAELEERIVQAQDKILKGPAQNLTALKTFFPEINNGDILAYVLDPKNAQKTIEKKVAAAQIGGAALARGLTTSLENVENLQRLGVEAEAAQLGYESIASQLPRASQLADIYGDTYDQKTAEAGQFGSTTVGAELAAKEKLRKLKEREANTFGGTAGVGALSRDRATSNYSQTQTGAGLY
jgi:hypothetical protein